LSTWQGASLNLARLAVNFAESRLPSFCPDMVRRGMQSAGGRAARQRSRRRTVMLKQLSRNWVDIRRDWPLLTLNQRLEAAVALLLTLVIDLVILIALYRLIVSVVDTLMLRTLNPLDHAVFQRVFGEIMTLLIALEFNHTMQYVITRERGIIQGKIVILIAQLALARKVIVTDPYEVPPTSVAALAALALALGATYWLMRDDRGGGADGPPQPPASEGRAL
jgi:uncharacterized membrane protein (DUF373 family)